MGDPAAAPPTPTTAENAVFLRQHRGELAKLAALRENRPVIVTTP
jgi:hypothetical protein